MIIYREVEVLKICDKIVGNLVIELHVHWELEDLCNDVISVTKIETFTPCTSSTK